VLVTVYQGQATTTPETASFIAIDPGAVSRLVDRLIDKGLITRTPDPAVTPAASAACGRTGPLWFSGAAVRPGAGAPPGAATGPLSVRLA